MSIGEEAMDLYSRQRRTSRTVLTAALTQFESHLHDLDELAVNQQPTPRLDAEIKTLRKAWNALTAAIAGLDQADAMWL